VTVRVGIRKRGAGKREDREGGRGKIPIYEDIYRFLSAVILIEKGNLLDEQISLAIQKIRVCLANLQLICYR
jgi:hypothetical protein